MTHEETIKRIQELVPDVMALEEGCKVKYKQENYTFTRSPFVEANTTGYYSPAYPDDDTSGKKDTLTILGKPITLAVVLLAINQKYIESNNVWFVYDLRQVQLSGIEKWNLSKDNFNDQSEETKTFIGGLLGN